jgi:hypothetical protein
MQEKASEFRDTLQTLIEASPDPMDHPSADQWIAYQRGELSEEEEARLQEHLVRCRDCFDLAEGAAAFAQEESAEEAGQDAESDELWRRLQSQIEPPPSKVREISSGPRRRSWGFRLPTVLAASFFAAFVGMAAWNVQLQSTVSKLSAPRPDIAILDLAPVERAAGSSEETLPATPGPAVLVLHPQEELPAYRLALHDLSAGRDLGTYELQPDRDLALTLQLPEGLRPGRYRLELSGASGKRVLETRILRITENREP